jgi:hypothetical protein
MAYGDKITNLMAAQGVRTGSEQSACGRPQDQGNHAQSKARSDAKLAELTGSDIFGGAQQVGHKTAVWCSAADCPLRVRSIPPKAHSGELHILGLSPAQCVALETFPSVALSQHSTPLMTWVSYRINASGCRFRATP